MAKKVPTSKIKDRASSEAKLIEAAEKIFSQVGYEGATTRMIAQEAGINLSLINRYFDGKYGLLIALVKKSTEEFLTMGLNYPPQADVQTELVQYGKFILSRHLESVNLIKVCFIQFLSDPKFLKKFRDIIMDLQAHPEILSRLETLAPKSKIDFSEIIDQIEIHALGMILTSFLLEGQSEKELHLRFKDFVMAYTNGIN